MSQNEVDELFGRGGGAPSPRTWLAVGLMLGGLAAAVCGLPCSTLPGGVLVLLGWFVVEQDADRLEAGYLPVDAAGRVRTLRWIAGSALVGVVLVVGVQFYLASRTPVYHALWTYTLQQVEAWRGPPPDPGGAPPDPGGAPPQGPTDAPPPAAPPGP
ncbi:MAG: hypothetical protein ABMA64_19715 [Myxococcota bacterium]